MATRSVGSRQCVLVSAFVAMWCTLADPHARVIADAGQRKGEFVLVVQGKGEDADAKLAEGRRVHAILARQVPPPAAAKLATEITGTPPKALYGAQ